MELSVSEILLLLVLFALPQVLIFLVTYGVYYFVAIKKGIPKLKPLHVVDIAMPVIAACIWAFFQTKSCDSKSFGNLVEISYMGIMWGALFVYRCWSVIVCRDGACLVASADSRVGRADNGGGACGDWKLEWVLFARSEGGAIGLSESAA